MMTISLREAQTTHAPPWLSTKSMISRASDKAFGPCWLLVLGLRKRPHGGWPSAVPRAKRWVPAFLEFIPPPKKRKPGRSHSLARLLVPTATPTKHNVRIPRSINRAKHRPNGQNGHKHCIPPDAACLSLAVHVLPPGAATAALVPRARLASASQHYPAQVTTHKKVEGIAQAHLGSGRYGIVRARTSFLAETPCNPGAVGHFTSCS